MKLGKLTLGCAAIACVAGCSSDPDGVNKAMNFLGTAATIAIEATQPPPPPPPVVVQQPVLVAQPVVTTPIVVQQPVVQQPVVQQPVVQQPVVQQPIVQQPVVQQPVVQQPVVQQPVQQPVVQQPVQQPVVQQPVVQQPVVQQPVQQPVQQSQPPVVAPTPALDASQFASQRTKAADTAEPTYSYGQVRFAKPATPEQIEAAAKKVKAGSRLRITFENVDDETVAAALARFPTASYVMLNKSSVKSLAPFALLTQATQLEFKNLKALNLAPLAGLKQLKKLGFTYCEVADFSPLAGLSELVEVDCYGATIGSFAGLATCSKLERVNFYAVKSTKEGYDSLGALKQVKKFHGGLTKMTSIAWLRQTPQAEEVEIFAEKIDDFTPISTLPNLTRLLLWNMEGDSMSTAAGDLSYIANCKKLQKLELPGSRYTTLKVLEGLTELRSVNLNNAKEPVSIAFALKLPKLERLELDGANVTDGMEIAPKLPKTVRVSTNNKTQGMPAAANP